MSKKGLLHLLIRTIPHMSQKGSKYFAVVSTEQPVWVGKSLQKRSGSIASFSRATTKFQSVNSFLSFANDLLQLHSFLIILCRGRYVLCFDNLSLRLY